MPDVAMQQHHERIGTIHVGMKQDDAFWYITRSYDDHVGNWNKTKTNSFFF